jgi:hypothetical protein
MIMKEDYTHYSIRNLEVMNTSAGFNISVATQVLLSHQRRQFNEPTVTYLQHCTTRKVLNITHDIQGDAEKSLARPTSRCRRKESIA